MVKVGDIMDNSPNYNIPNIYNQFLPAENICECIVDFLFNSPNAKNFWKLLYYAERDCLYKPDLTDAQKANMICKDPTIDGATATKNIIFQKDIDDGFTLNIPQVRFYTGDFTPINDYTGAIEILVEIVVPNKLSSGIITDKTQVGDRAYLIGKEIQRNITHDIIPNCGANSLIFMNKSAPSGVGNGNGWWRVTANKNYSGYFLCFSILC